MIGEHIDRRIFLLTNGLGLVISALRPQLALAADQINLELKIDEETNDVLTRELGKKRKESILYDALERAGRIYADMGKPYGLNGLQINPSLHTEGQPTPEGAIVCHYATLDRTIKRIETDPNIIEHVLGKEEADKIKTLGLEEETRAKLIARFKQEVPGAGGAALPGAKETYLLARDFYDEIDPTKEATRAGAVALLGYTGAHELGHIFGLKHDPDATQATIMTTNPTKSIILNPRLSEEQVRAVLAHFGQ